MSVGVLGQVAPHETVQLPAETVQAAPLPLQMPAEAGSSVAGVQLQVPQGGPTGQLGGETVQGSPLRLQMPAEGGSSVRRVQLQVPQGGGSTGQLPAETVQSAPLMLQIPSDGPSSVSGVQLQVPHATGQLFAATVQRRDEPVQEAPPHPGATAWLLDCVPALDASVVDGVQLQLPQGPH